MLIYSACSNRTFMELKFKETREDLNEDLF